MIDQLSSEMRKNHKGVEAKEPVEEISSGEKDETLVNWTTLDGIDALKFRCLIFTNQEPKREVMIYALPVRDKFGFFVDKYVTFKIFRFLPLSG